MVKSKDSRKLMVVIDIGLCSLCKGCVEVAPGVFRYNSVIHMMEVADLDEYPRELVDEAIKNCPEDCISWQHHDELKDL